MKIKGLDLYQLRLFPNASYYFLPDYLAFRRGVAQFFKDSDSGDPVSVVYYLQDASGRYVKRFTEIARGDDYSPRADIVRRYGVKSALVSLERKLPDETGRDEKILRKIREFSTGGDLFVSK